MSDVQGWPAGWPASGIPRKQSGIETGCPDCGSDGPHPVVDKADAQRMTVIVECLSCYIEFLASTPEEWR